MLDSAFAGAHERHKDEGITMVKVLCIHGVGHEEDTPKPQWQQDWTAAITAGIHDSNAAIDVEVAFVEYDALFEPVLNNLTAADVSRAFYKIFARDHRRRLWWSVRYPQRLLQYLR